MIVFFYYYVNSIYIQIRLFFYFSVLFIGSGKLCSRLKERYNSTVLGRGSMNYWIILGAGALLSYILTYLFILKRPGEGLLLGHDRGRKFAEGAEVNIGKPTGTGLYFTIIFTLVTMACIYLYQYEAALIFGAGVTFLAMITGLLDDRSKKAWNEYIKGVLSQWQ